MSLSVATLRCLKLVNRAGVATAAHLNISDRQLRSLVTSGYLVAQFVPVGDSRIRCYTLGKRATRTLGFPHPAPLRPAFVEHQLRTLDAVLLLQRTGQCGKVVDFKAEHSLVREAFAGNTFRPGASTVAVDKLPDAVITVERDGARDDVRVEYVSRKYTDEQIRAKATAWTSGSTVWVCSDSATSGRLARLTGQPAILLPGGGRP